MEGGFCTETWWFLGAVVVLLEPVWQAMATPLILLGLLVPELGPTLQTIISIPAGSVLQLASVVDSLAPALGGCPTRSGF